MFRIRKLDERGIVTAEWLYARMNGDKIQANVDHASGDLYVSCKIQALINREKIKGRLFKPPMELESPFTGLYSTLIRPIERAIIDPITECSLLWNLKQSRKRHQCFAMHNRSILPIMLSDKKRPLPMSSELEEYVFGINDICEGYPLNHVTVQLGPLPIGRELTVSTSQDKYENMCYTYYLVLFESNASATFNVLGLKDWKMNSGDIIVWSPYDNADVHRQIITTGDVYIVTFRSVMKYFMDNNGDKYMWLESGDYIKIIK